jgi:hypothetical protein
MVSSGAIRTRSPVPVADFEEGTPDLAAEVIEQKGTRP